MPGNVRPGAASVRDKKADRAPGLVVERRPSGLELAGDLVTGLADGNTYTPSVDALDVRAGGGAGVWAASWAAAPQVQTIASVAALSYPIGSTRPRLRSSGCGIMTIFRAPGTSTGGRSTSRPLGFDQETP